MISRYSWSTLNPDNLPLSIVVTKMRDVVPEHSHDFHELVFFTNGSCVHHVLGDNGATRSYAVIQGDVFAIRENEQHSYDQGGQSEFCNIIFRTELIENELEFLQDFPMWNQFFGDQRSVERMKTHLSPAVRQEMAQLVGCLGEELRLRTAGYRMVAKNIFLQILIKILRTPMKPLLRLADRSVPRSILASIAQIEDAPEQNYPLEEMARDSAMCVASFTKKFRQFTGQSPKEFILAQRFRKAEGMLGERTHKLDEIAFQCGFYDTNYFIKQFKKRYGATPGRYIKTENILASRGEGVRQDEGLL